MRRWFWTCALLNSAVGISYIVFVVSVDYSVSRIYVVDGLVRMRQCWKFSVSIAFGFMMKDVECVFFLVFDVSFVLWSSVTDDSILEHVLKFCRMSHLWCCTERGSSSVFVCCNCLEDCFWIFFMIRKWVSS